LGVSSSGKLSAYIFIGQRKEKKEKSNFNKKKYKVGAD
jgi:hypothetical protein